MTWHWYVYIIECLDKSYYVGMTWSLPLRYEQHLSGLGGIYTGEHGVRRLAYYEEHNDFGMARRREHQIKSWSRAKKERLISGEWGKEW
jgi:putative endonuclease